MRAVHSSSCLIADEPGSLRSCKIAASRCFRPHQAYRSSFFCSTQFRNVRTTQACTQASSGKTAYSRFVNARGRSSKPVLATAQPKTDRARFKKILSDVAALAFVFLGVLVCYLVTAWAGGKPVSVTGQPYDLILELPFAYKVHEGTPVRMRGVEVGSVKSVHGYLDRVDVVLEMNDAHNIVVPRGSKFEATLTGLAAAAAIEITPPPEHIVPHESFPMDLECEAEGKLYCHLSRAHGLQGTSSDEMLRVMLNIMHGRSKKPSRSC